MAYIYIYIYIYMYMYCFVVAFKEGSLMFPLQLQILYVFSIIG